MLTRSPWDSLPVYLCRFAVRSPELLPTRFFLAAWDHSLCGPKTSASHLTVWNGGPDLPSPPGYLLATCTSNRRLSYPPASPLRSNVIQAGQEYSPASLRLRPSSSTKRPPNPERTDLPQETLDLRREGFSPSLSLLVLAVSLLCRPPVLTV